MGYDEATAAAPLASLSITHVYYDPHDRVSLVCAYLALLPQALGVVYLTLIFASREVEIALLFAGQLACEALNFALKRLIKEERPRRIHGKGYGMPSSHAQFVFFWSVALTLFLLVRHRPTTTTTTTTTPRSAKPANGGGGRLAERVAVSAASLALAAATAWSRVYLDYHTPRQVLVGSSVGALTAVAWFVLTAVLRSSGLLAWALDLPVVRALRVRDLIVEEDLSEAGWDRWEERRRRAAKNNKSKVHKAQ
ncbi:PAP2 superfamily protein [Cordyceps javanica]|uniref:Dolichyldiphosphatase n=1 Tax=Cordyceps javanica TaxID=43265 RepID=A0A545VC02_9HYPO|nr:PAP2 superfamily protein [Cordyceps javanica]TQW11068.1 PAP2 superfamily protein [Cordyceps javanica]